MMTLIAAALAAAAPAAPAQPVHPQHQGQPAEHKDCCADGCKECCKDMAKHDGHGSDEHGDHAQ
ncbi:MAG TPA: hypothetical protein VF079_10710 [Sphingomicrobium sp.]